MTSQAEKSPYTDRTDAFPEFEATLERYPRRHVIQEVRALSKVNGWRSTGLLVLNWGIILAVGAATIYSGHWLAYLIAIPVIATRQQVLGVMMHDAAHYLLYKNRTVNDVVCDLFISFPIGLSVELYRATHFRHHLYTNTSDDPDLGYQSEDPDWFEWPKTRWGCFWMIVRSMLGLNVLKGYKPYKLWSPGMNLFLPLNGKPTFKLRSRILFILSSIVIYAIAFGFGIVIPMLLLWMLPGMTLLNFVNRLRATAEHIGAPNQHELNATRTVIPTLFERLWIAPLGVNYHLEHHLFPSVPGPNLSRLHEVLMQDEEFRGKAHVTDTYTGVIRELMAQQRGSAWDLGKASQVTS